MKSFDATLFYLGQEKTDMPASAASTDATHRRACSTLTGPVWLAVFLLCTAVSAAAQCTGPGAPTATQTQCVTGIAIPGTPIRSFDISWVDPNRGLYFLADRSNKGVDIISTATKTFLGRAGDTSGPGSFVGILPGPGTLPVDNNHSGPDGVVSRGKCLYAGDGNSTLKVFDISDPSHPVFVKSISTGGTTRVDEMALTSDGDYLIAANNSEDPPFATLFAVDGDDGCDSISAVNKITVSPTFIPAGFGLSIEQPTWDESTQRFLASVPTIKDNPTGCTFGPPNTCSGAMLVIDPTNLLTPVETVVPLIHCGPNGITIGPHGNAMEGCTPNNQPGDLETTIINAKNFKYVDVGGLTGSDEVWYDSGSNRYYTGSSAMPTGAVLGVVDGETNFLLETIPQSSASHSVAADRRRHEVFVPQVAPFAVVGIGGDKTPVGAGICGSSNGCIAVYAVPRSEDNEDGDHHHSRD